MGTKPTNENLLQRLTRENEERRAEMVRGQQRYWQTFNIAGRFIGGCFFVAGFIVFASLLTHGEILGAVMGAVVAVLGILMMCAKPSRPDITKDHKTDL